METKRKEKGNGEIRKDNESSTERRMKKYGFWDVRKVKYYGFWNGFLTGDGHASYGTCTLVAPGAYLKTPRLIMDIKNNIRVVRLMFLVRVMLTKVIKGIPC